ncbi:hypothetical protein PO768_27810, partial [Paucibacter sp. XJ19-41]
MGSRHDAQLHMGRRALLGQAPHQAQLIGSQFLVHQHGDPVGQRVEQRAPGGGALGLLGGGLAAQIAEQGQKGLGEAFIGQHAGVAEKERVAEHRVARLRQAAGQGVEAVFQPRAQYRGQAAAQPEVLDDDDTPARERAIGGDVQRALQAGQRAVLACQRRRIGQHPAGALGRQARLQAQAQPAGQPGQGLGRAGHRIGQQCAGGDAGLDIAEHALEQQQKALQEIRRAGAAALLGIAAEQLLVIERRQIAVAVGQTAGIGAQRRQLRRGPAIAEQLDRHPQPRALQGPHRGAGALDQHREQPRAAGLGR